MLISSTTHVSPKDNYFIMGKGWLFNACGVDNYTRDMIWLCGLCQHCGVEKLGLVPINYNFIDIGQLVTITLISHECFSSLLFPTFSNNLLLPD